MDSNPSQTSPHTQVVAKMHKEDQEATSDSKSFGVTRYDTSTDLQLKLILDYLLLMTLYLNNRKEASSIARKVEEEEASRTIKLEDLANLVSHVQPSFKDLDSPEDDHIIVVDDSDKDEEADTDEGLHATSNIETKGVYPVVTGVYVWSLSPSWNIGIDKD
ncbi:hypothetical protein Tco_0056367 [Tanacetum coccineum]